MRREKTGSGIRGPVDIFVQRPIGESYANRDSQLDAAVKELLTEIDGGKGK